MKDQSLLLSLSLYCANIIQTSEESNNYIPGVKGSIFVVSVSKKGILTLVVVPNKKLDVCNLTTRFRKDRETGRYLFLCVTSIVVRKTLEEVRQVVKDDEYNACILWGSLVDGSGYVASKSLSYIEEYVDEYYTDI